MRSPNQQRIIAWKIIGDPLFCFYKAYKNSICRGLTKAEKQENIDANG